MSNQQIADPKGTFGRSSIPGSNRQNVTVATMRNMTTLAIPAGAVLQASTLSTDGTGVTVSTAINSPLVVGVALTSASTGSTAGSSLAPEGAWLSVVTKGPVQTILTTTITPGDILGSGGSTIHVGGTIGGAAAAVTTAPGSGAHGILGYCLKASSDTNSTGMLGVVYVDISRYVTTA